jgi:hypothetical protein
MVVIFRRWAVGSSTRGRRCWGGGMRLNCVARRSRVPWSVERGMCCDTRGGSSVLVVRRVGVRYCIGQVQRQETGVERWRGWEAVAGGKPTAYIGGGGGGSWNYGQLRRGGVMAVRGAWFQPARVSTNGVNGGGSSSDGRPPELSKHRAPGQRPRRQHQLEGGVQPEAHQRAHGMIERRWGWFCKRAGLTQDPTRSASS